MLMDLLDTIKPHGASKIPAWAVKDAKAVLAETLCCVIIQLVTEKYFLDI